MNAKIYSFVTLLSAAITDAIKSLNDDDEVNEIVHLHNEYDNLVGGKGLRYGNINNPEDVKYLFDAYGGDNPRVEELGLMVVNRGSNFFTLDNNEATFVHFDDIAEVVEQESYSLAKYLVSKPEDFPYLWKLYVTDKFDEED